MKQTVLNYLDEENKRLEVTFIVSYLCVVDTCGD